MITKNIQLSGEDLVKKLTEVPFKKKEARTGHPTTYADDLKLIHQLQVLSLEIEMKHEQRRKDPISLDELNRKQTELFEFAPNGYFALNTEGIIQEVNLTGANILGMSRKQLEQQLFLNFVIPEDQDIFRICLFNLMNTNGYQVFKVNLIRSDGHRVNGRIALSGTWIKKEFYILLALTDVTMWKQVEEAQTFLLGCNWSKSGKDFFQALTEYLGKSMEMDYVSIDKLIDSNEAEVVSVYHGEDIQSNEKYSITDTAFVKMLDRRSFCYPNGAHHLFPNDRILQQINAESYAGVTLWGSEDRPIGFIVMIGRKPIVDSQLTEMVLKQVSIRAAAELEHGQLEKAIIQSRELLEVEVRERTAELQAANDQLRNEIQIRKQQEESLKVAKERYRMVAEFTYHWETWLDPSGEYIYVSPSCKRISGYSVEEFMHDPTLLIKIAHLDDRQMVEEHFAKELKGELSSGLFEYRIITRDGVERWIGHHCQPVFDTSGNFMGQRGSNLDITQRKVAEKIMMDSQKHLRQLSQRMEAITEAERTRIAREIHDELGHVLSALKFEIEGISNQSELSAEDLKNEWTIMIDMVDSLIDSVKKIATELRPGILDHLGLVPAIEWQIKQFRLRTKICCSFTLEEMDIDFNKNETNIIFRILQEILTNITRHSEAKHVNVNLAKSDSNFIMEVTDDGVGFEYDENQQVNTLGLMGMKERALSIGGKIFIDTKPGKGTKLRFLLPGIRR